MSDNTQGGLDATVQVKQNPRGGFSIPGNVSLDPTENTELLRRMQEMVAQREGPLNQLMSGLKDAAAWTVPNLEGRKTAALNERDQQKAAEAQELFRMRSDMAALRSAQGQQELLKKQYEGLNAPQGGGTTAETSPIPGLSMQQVSSIASNPSVKAELDTLSPNDYAGRLAVIREAAKAEFGAGLKGKFEAAGNKQEPYTIPGIGKNGGDGVVMMTPNEYLEFKATRKLPGGESVSKAAATAIVPATTDSIAFNDPSINIISAKRTPEKGQELWEASVKNGTPGIQPNGLPVAKPGTSPHETEPSGNVLDIDPKKLTRAGRTELAQKGYYQPLGTDSPHWERVPGLQTAPAVTAPTATATTTPVKASAATTTTVPTTTEPQLKDYPTKGAYDTALKLYEQKQAIPVEAAKTETTTSATEAGKRRAKMFELADQTDQTVKAADMAIAASTNVPEATGIGKGKTGANVLVTAAGAIIPKMDKAKAEDIYGSFQSDPAIKAREAIVGSSKQLGIDFAANVFKGARMGIGLENMAANAKNVSEYNTAETNIINAKLIKEAALFNRARAELYDRWAPNNGGAMANFEKFETSDEYKALAKATQEKIASELPQYLKVGKDGLEEVNPIKKSNSQNDARAELERRKKAKGNQ